MESIQNKQYGGERPLFGIHDTDWNISPSRMASRGLNAARMWSVTTRNSMANILGGTLMAA